MQVLNKDLEEIVTSPQFINMLLNLDNIEVGIVDREPFAKHRKRCSGCSDCLLYRRILKVKEKIFDETELVDGITLGQAVEMRKCRGIDYYFPNGDEIRDPETGEIDLKVYVFLKNQDGPNNGHPFTDQEIFDYFKINQSEAQKFKARYFPNGKNTDDINMSGLESIEYYKKKFNKPLTRVKKRVG